MNYIVTTTNQLSDFSQVELIDPRPVESILDSGGRRFASDKTDTQVSDSGQFRFDNIIHQKGDQYSSVITRSVGTDGHHSRLARTQVTGPVTINVCATATSSCVDTVRPAKRVKSQFQDSELLHRACCNPNVTVDDLAQILLQDPTSINRKMELATTRPVYNPSTGELEQRILVEPYKYALNLALEHCANFDVIEMLVTADPSVLLESDGVQGDYSLLIVLKRWPRSCVMMDLLLLKNPLCVTVTDRHQNTALHVACLHGASVEVLCHLCILHRHALWMQNFHGQTPVMVAQNRSSSCPDAIVQLLWKMMEA